MAILDERIARFTRSLADMDLEELKQTIADLNTRSFEIGCAIFPARHDHDTVVLMFAGAGGVHFDALTLASDLECEVVYFQDPTNAWYQGSALLPSAQSLALDWLPAHVGTRRAIFIGQSSGAYACLVAARDLPGSATIALSPQTYSDARDKDRFITIGDIRFYATTEGLSDIAALWQGAQADRFVAIVSSTSETGNPPGSHYWMDHLHIARLMACDTFRFFLVNGQNHNLLHGHAKGFARLLRRACETPNEALEELMRDELTEIFIAPAAAAEQPA